MSDKGVDYCVIGGLAVNAYAEPLVSFDLDIVVTAEDIETVCHEVEHQFKIQRLAHSIKLSTGESDSRVQRQTDDRYQAFISKAQIRNVLGYEMKVAELEDVLQGKIWAHSDEQRRMSKRQMDLADILRLVETYPTLIDRLPDPIRSIIK